MELMLASGLFLLAAGFAMLMGVAIQRGATCAVAAVEEVLQQGSATRLVALLEASLWVAAGLALARQLHWLSQAPAGHAVSGWTLLGGVLLGAGAFVNRGCVFGAVARLGSGDWAYLATPLGFYLGCLTAPLLFTPAPMAPSGSTSPVLAMPGAVALALGALLLARAAWGRRLPAQAGIRTHASRSIVLTRLQHWTPHGATRVIALSFMALTLVSGTWAYTDVLAELARGMSHSLTARLALVLCMLAGAVAGGWRTARWAPLSAAPGAVARCLAGGWLMGWGSQLTPGGNDGLILVGMPLLEPYAWVAFASMCGTIALALRVQQRLRTRSA